MDEMQWYIIYLGNPKKSNHLQETIASIAGDCVLWAPNRLVLTSKRGKTVTVEKPLFPGYVFAKFKYPDSSVDSAISLNCSASLLRGPGADGPSPVTIEKIAALKKQAEEQSLTQSTAEQYGLEVGQKVEITVGPFLGWTGSVIGIKKDKIMVEVSIFGRRTIAEIDPSSCTQRDSDEEK